MLELMLIFLMVGGWWLLGSLIGLFFKLAFGLMCVLFGLLAGMLGMLISGVMLLVLPLIALALLPALWLLGLVWAAVHWLGKPAVTPVVLST